MQMVQGMLYVLSVTRSALHANELSQLTPPARVSKSRYARKKYPSGQPHSGPCSRFS